MLSCPGLIVLHDTAQPPTASIHWHRPASLPQPWPVGPGTGSYVHRILGFSCTQLKGVHVQESGHCFSQPFHLLIPEVSSLCLIFPEVPGVGTHLSSIKGWWSGAHHAQHHRGHTIASSTLPSFNYSIQCQCFIPSYQSAFFRQH